MRLTPGTKLRSAASNAQFIVIRGVDEDLEVTLAGAPATDGDPGAVAPNDGPQMLVGKRYVGSGKEIEVLCTMPGSGPVEVNGEELIEQAAKSLPSSD